ncbi:Uncharacterized protein PECH_005096 [Penicillium ucsense]|uniref:Uncharacterized protein n=1 Tax=Penicillium ucsense TaxID=2839758 RepID=A0A8J8W7Q7_9EURO|nr:Uncharacterized protein PECM_004292 [Penicillium ucsense]KAF7736590.1 Uncharacterized protein PECH_005096 [Penicillium ucsense]
MSEIPPGTTTVLALDFGTTYSGVAWAQVASPEFHYLINQWPLDTSGSRGGMTSEKVPTELAFIYRRSKRKIGWGFQIPETMPRLQCFKLRLDPDQKELIFSALAKSHKDWRQMNYPHHATPVSVTTDYLRAVLNHVHSVLKSQVGPAFDHMTFVNVITVPAMWSDKARACQRTCATDAGFGDGSSIHIISEPEAAAIHALRASSPNNLDVGDTVLLIDAGGGTVDLITFTIEQLLPCLRLREAASGIGAYCGSSYLNRRFEDFIRQTLASDPDWNSDTLDDAMERFELFAKRRFTGDTTDTFTFPVPGIADNEDLNVRRGRFQITGQEMRDIFLPVLAQVLKLAKQQIESSQEPIKAALLVGGFGQNQFLRNYLQDNISQDIRVLAPPDGWSAVVRGALAKVLSQASPTIPQVLITSRIARLHYGHLRRALFDPLLHERNRAYWNDYRGALLIHVMHWCIVQVRLNAVYLSEQHTNSPQSQGQSISEIEPVITEWHMEYLVSQGRPSEIQVIFYESATPEPPQYLNRCVRQHATLEAKLDADLQQLIPIEIGYDGEKYYVVKFQFHAHYYSAHCSISLWYQSRQQGEVKISYL